MISKRIVLKFSEKLIGKSIICKLVKEYNLDFNILKANVTPDEEGLLVIEFTGSEQNFEKAVTYLKKIGVKVQPLKKDIIHNEEKCTHCGACIVICHSRALVMDSKTRKVKFYDKKCSACELCVKACPPRAMEVHF